MPKKLDLKGKRFKKLLVLCESTKRKDAHVMWDCLCDCGQIVSIRGISLTTGSTISCGCHKRTTHGHAGKGRTETYRVWSGMIDRYSGNRPHYGGRGICVWSRWQKFKNFLCDMGEKPKNLTLERIDINRDYCPKNCKWATKQEQANNKRVSVFLSFKGELKTVADWARYFKVAYDSLYYYVREKELKYGTGLSVAEAIEKIRRIA